jgi:prophage tail gpP-like protein
MSAAHGVVTRGPPPGATDQLTLIVGNQSLTGWQRVSVTRPLAAIPASFSIETTERYPNAPDIALQAGQPCTVQIGSDLVLTGYVDRYASSVSAGNHTVRIEGRSKSCDLVDCSALVQNTSAGSPSTPGMQILNGDAVSIARTLAAQYKVTINTSAEGPFRAIPQLNINLGETVWEIIDRITRYSELVPYDMPDGSVMLAIVGTQSMASGFTLGDNIEAADIMMSMDQRYQEYEGHLMSTMALGTDAGVNAPLVGQIVRDDDVPRFRKLYVISEQTINGQPIAGQRAIWEKNRRWGQSFAFSVTCDSWRDAAGTLWAPNMLAPVNAPQLKVDPNKSWLIGTVTYTRDEHGQHAHLGLWPKEAFSVEPTAPSYLMMNEGLNANNPTAPNADATTGGNPPARTVPQV